MAAGATLTICFAIDASAKASNDGLWGVGALMLLVATASGFLAVATISAEWQRCKRWSTDLSAMAHE